MKSTAAIKQAFDQLRWQFDNETINWPDRLLTQCEKEEREHRGVLPEFARYHTHDTISVRDAARMFAVKRVAEYVLGASYPCGQDYLHSQHSCFIAAGIADEFGDKIRAIWQPDFLKWLSELNYTDFVKTREPMTA